LKKHLAHIALMVRDYDEAIDFYTRILGFTLTEDTPLTPEKRWVLVTPPGGGCSLLLAKAANEEQAKFIGNQCGGRVFLFLYTSHFERDYQALLINKVKIARAPKTETYGMVVVFEDLYGNLWDLIEPANLAGE